MSERHDVRRKVVAVSEPLTSERLAELRRIAEAATPGPWEWDKYLHLFSATGKPVLTKPFSPDNPDVVEARPEDLDYIERFNPETVLVLLDRIEALEQERDAARAEAERWRKKYEALMAAVIKTDELIVDAINYATEMYNYTQDDYYESYSDGLDEALTILRQLLDEAGGGDT